MHCRASEKCCTRYIERQGYALDVIKRDIDTGAFHLTDESAIQFGRETQLLLRQPLRDPMGAHVVREQFP